MTDRTDLHTIVARVNPVPDPSLTAQHIDPHQSLLAVIDERSEALAHSARESRQIMGSSLPLWRRNAWAFAATFALTLIAIGVTVLVAGRDTTPVADERITQTTVPDTVPPATTVATTVPDTPVTTVSPVRPLLSWVRVEDQDAFADAAIIAVTRGGPGLIAVGEADEEVPLDDFGADVAVWVSADGTAWERIHDPSFAGQPDSTCAPRGVNYQGVRDVASGPLGIVATGTDGCHAAVWISDDGRTWTEVIDDDWFENPGVIWSVTAGGPGWVVVGGDGHGNGVVWVSEDGVDWTTIQDDDLLAATGSRVDLRDVTVGGPGLVAVGSTGFRDSGSLQSAIWVSTDGFDWEKLPDDTIDHGALFWIDRDERSDRLMVLSRPTWTAPDWMAWTSTDGINWNLTGVLGESTAGGVVWSGDRLVAAGMVSTDGGATWIDIGRDLPGFDGHFMSDVTGFGDQIVVVGYQPGVLSRAGLAEAPGSTAAIWIGEWTTG
jgi:hypothetical protein